MRRPGDPFWVPSASLQRHLNRTATGNPENDWLSYVRAVHLPAVLSRTLVIGCGSGFLERALVRKDGVGTVLATDADPGEVAAARAHAERAGLAAISHAALDPDRDAIPPGPWDAVIVHGALHRTARPEAILEGIREQLAPDGRFVVHDYVGPARYRYAEERMELVTRYFRLLPDRLRREPATGRVLWKPQAAGAARLPSEDPAAAAAEPLPERTRRAFVTEAEYSGAGGLLHPLLTGLAENFGAIGAEEERLLAVLCAAEAYLEASGQAAPSFRIFVGRPRAAGAAGIG